MTDTKSYRRPDGSLRTEAKGDWPTAVGILIASVAARAVQIEISRRFLRRLGHDYSYWEVWAIAGLIQAAGANFEDGIRTTNRHYDKVMDGLKNAGFKA